MFGWAVGPHSWKEAVPVARAPVARRAADGGPPAIDEEPPPERPLALLGARSCDLHAIAIQDRVFLEGRYVERDYALRREGVFVVAVNCGEPGGCFCTSMGTGPRAESGFDLALTELMDGEHRFFVEVGSDRGRQILASLPVDEATADEKRRGRGGADAAERMGRQLDTAGLPELLAANLDHARFAEVAERCLTCGNCTLVCPTCFCSSVDDVNDLSDGSSERWRSWDSCFSTEHSYIHGGSVRRSPRARYRQWLTQVRHVVRPVRHVGLRRLRPVHHLVPGRDRRHRGAGRDPCHGRRWTVRTLDELIAQAPVFAGLDADALALIAGCARNVGFEEQELFRDGEPADTFYVVRRGRVALELHTPERGGS